MIYVPAQPIINSRIKRQSLAADPILDDIMDEIDTLATDPPKPQPDSDMKPDTPEPHYKELDPDDGDVTEKAGAKLPHFFGEMTARDETSFTFSISYNGVFPFKVKYYEIVVLKLEKDTEGIPRLYKTNSSIWQTFVPYTDSPSTNEPWIAARYSEKYLPSRITIGDRNVSNVSRLGL